jgi:hypothetical protein
LCIHYRAKLLDVIMAIRGLGFSVHLHGTNIMANIWGGNSHAKLLGSIYAPKEVRCNCGM